MIAADLPDQPHGPQRLRKRDIYISEREMMASIARYKPAKFQQAVAALGTLSFLARHTKPANN